MNMSFWPEVQGANASHFTGLADAEVVDRALSSFDGVAGTNFAGTPWLKGILITQSAASNTMAITFPPGFWGANRIEVTPANPLQLRVGMRCCTTGDDTGAICGIDAYTANIIYQNTFKGPQVYVNNTATEFRRGFVGGVTKKDGDNFHDNSFSQDIIITNDAGASLALQAAYVPCVATTSTPTPLDTNERVLHVTRLFED